MTPTAGSPLPITRTYTGWGLNPALLAKSAGEWLKKKGYEVQSAASGDTNFVQARIVETGWKSWFAKCPSLEVRVAGGTDRMTVGFGDGTWGLDPSQLSVGHKVGGFLTAVWSGDAAHRRKAIESEFWAVVEVACRACGALERTEPLASTVTGISKTVGGLRRDGTLPGLEEYHENFRCSACDHRWEGPKKTRAVSLCPGCEKPLEPVHTGETVLGSSLVGESSPGVFAGDVTQAKNYRCPGCSHTWHGPEATRRMTVCPACVQPAACAEVRREVTGTVRREEARVARSDHWGEGSKRHEIQSTSYTQYTVPVEYEVSVSVHRCEHCSHEWTGGQHERRLG
jgi:hypothetical protein